MNIKSLIIIFILTLPLVYGEVTIEYSTDNLTWQNVTDVNEQVGEGYAENLQEGTLYYFRAKNDTTDWNYLSVRTDTSGEKGMSSLSITGFILLITFGLLLLPSFKKQFVQHEMLNTILRGCCYILGLYLLALDATIIVSLSNTFGLNVSSEIFVFLWIISRAAYLTMFIVFLSFGYKSLELWKMEKNNRKMGYLDDEGQNT